MTRTMQYSPICTHGKPIWKVDRNTYDLMRKLKSGEIILNVVDGEDYLDFIAIEGIDILKVKPTLGATDVIFNGPATIIKWNDGTKTVVKCHEEEFDYEKGIAMAICKRVMGNKGNYYNVIKKLIERAALDK